MCVCGGVCVHVCVLEGVWHVCVCVCACACGGGSMVASSHPTDWDKHFPHSYVWYYHTMHCVNCVHSVGLWLVVPWASPMLLWLHHPLTPLVPLVP